MTFPQGSADHLMAIASELANGKEKQCRVAWEKAIREVSTEDLVRVIGRLGSTGTHGARFSALRDQLRVEVDRRVAEDLSASASRLTKVGIAVTIALGLASIIVAIAVAI